MNNGKSIQELAQELDRRANSKHDVVANSSDIRMRPNGDLHLEVVGDGEYGINDVAHRQIASVTNIPLGYYDRLRASDNAMVAGNVNHWLEKSGKRHMVRTMDGTARAVLSDRYLRIENENIAQGILPVLYDINGCVPLATDITDRKMYLKFLFDDLEADITGNGDIVKAGITITNSEVGMGQYLMRGFFYRSFCDNGCHFGHRDMGLEFARRHLGSKVDVGVQEVFSTETVKKNHEAIVSASVDILKYISSPESFNKMVEQLRATTQGEVIAPTHVREGVEVLGKEYGLTSEERVQMMGNLIEDNDFTRWGVINSVTKIANDVDFDRAHELENVGGKLIDLTQNMWNTRVDNINAMAVAA